MITTFKQFLNEKYSNNFQEYPEFLEIAKGNSYDVFLDKTDRLTNYYEILYRGMYEGDTLQDFSFMTDYVDHAREYTDDGNVDGIIYDEKDLILITDGVFDSLRIKYRGITKEQLREMYEPYIQNKMDDDEEEVIDFVSKFLKSKTPYTKIQQNFTKNNYLIPIMLEYIKSIGKNILSFWGSDYSDYGGAAEFVVYDMSRYPKLSDIWKSVN